MNRRPFLGFGLRHIALRVRDLEACERFYVELLGMEVEWRPDADNLYLTSGGDNLALHRVSEAPAPGGSLDHLGFMLASAEAVDQWHAWLQSQGVKLLGEPRTHRDGARSFYCEDPEGNRVQFIHHPPVCSFEAEVRGADDAIDGM